MTTIRWERGGEAIVTRIDGERIECSSTVSAAPGTPLQGQLSEHGTFKVKVIGCQRDQDRWRITGRLVDLRREVREALLALTSSPSA